MNNFRPTYAEINLRNLQHNFKIVQSIDSTPTSRFICPMIKANAYGHGAKEIGFALSEIGVRRFGVCLLEEALELRKFKLKGEILVFQPVPEIKSVYDLVWQYQLTPVVTSLDQLHFWLAHQLPGLIPIHLKIDTGMNRFGVDPKEVEKALKLLFTNKEKLRLKGIGTHLVQGEDFCDKQGRSFEQLEVFEQTLIAGSDFFKKINSFSEVEVHALNSAAICRMIKIKKLESNPYFHFGLRPGLMLYGVNPLKDCEMNLRSVMTLKSRISHFRHLVRGETVSYNGTWTAKRDTLIAVVPVGYGDGVSLAQSNCGVVLVNGIEAPIVGRVCMDSIMVDVTNLTASDLGRSVDKSEVVLWGKARNGCELPVNQVASVIQSHAWEILTSPSSRVPRSYLTGAEARESMLE